MMILRSVGGTLTPYQIWYLGISTFPAILFAVFYLGQVRVELYLRNIFDPYYQVNESYPALPTNCCDAYLNIRSADGRCNDFNIPSMGMYRTRFGRNTNITIKQVLDKSNNLLHPHPLKLSNLMERKNGRFVESPNINLLAAAWIQFQIHDWFRHRTDEHAIPIKIPNLYNDGTYLKLQPTLRDSKGYTINEATHWWDGSMIYGSTIKEQKTVRSFKGGKLIADRQKLSLKLDKKSGLPITAVLDNWWIGLSLMHRIFIAEHNYLAELLSRKYPRWNDEEIFQHVRLILAAILAKIHTVEWTPTILQNPVLAAGMNINWYGVGHVFNYTLEQFIQFGLPASATALLAQIQKGVGGTRNFAGRPYAMSEEFVSVYRMHPLLPDQIQLRPIKCKERQSQPSIPMSQLTLKDAEINAEKYGIDNWFNTFGYARAGHLTFNNYPHFLTNVKIDKNRFVNVAVIDIIRDRERLGLRYNELRRQLRLQPISSFADLSVTQEEEEQLREIYQNDVELLDVFVGLMAEANWPAGYGFSNTAFHIFIIMASRRLEADRFYKEYYNATIYTQLGIDYIENTDFKTILLRHLPSLYNNLRNITQVFAPW